MQLSQRLKEHHCEFNPSRMLSEDQAMVCLTLGLTTSTCENYSMKQMLIVDVEEDTMAQDTLSEDTVPPRVEEKDIVRARERWHASAINRGCQNSPPAFSRKIPKTVAGCLG